MHILPNVVILEEHGPCVGQILTQLGRKKVETGERHKQVKWRTGAPTGPRSFGSSFELNYLTFAWMRSPQIYNIALTASDKLTPSQYTVSLTYLCLTK